MKAAVAQLTWKVDYRALAIEGLDRVLLAPALRKLPVPTHVEVRVAAANITDFFSLRQGTDGMASLVDAVDFPAFVADLIRGTFDAIVDASIQHMEAYGELLKEVSETVDEFLQDLEDDCLRHYQHLVADMLLSGIYRISRAARRGR
jgi:hypothetical protein